MAALQVGDLVLGKYKIVALCAAPDCGAPLISDAAWRLGVRPEGVLRHEGRGVCGKHYHRLKRHDSLEPPPRPATGAQSPEAVNVYDCRSCGVRMTSHHHIRRWPELKERYAPSGGQGHCRSCYEKGRRAGEIERVVRRTEDTLEDWEFMRDDGDTLEQAARRLGVKPKSLEQTLYRARQKGDPRGSLVPFAHDMRSAA